MSVWGDVGNFLWEDVGGAVKDYYTSGYNTLWDMGKSAWGAITGDGGGGAKPYEVNEENYRYGGGGADELANRHTNMGAGVRWQGDDARDEAYEQAKKYSALGRTADQRAMAMQNRQVENSRAQAQLNQGLDRGMAQNLAMARSGRGFGGSATAERQAAANNAIMAQRTNQDAAVLRADEEARQRQMNDQMTQFYSGQQMGYEGMGEQARGRGDTFQQSMYGLGQDYDQMAQGVYDSDLAARMQMEGQKSQNVTQMQLANSQAAQAQQGGLMNMAATGLSAYLSSDERAKTDIKDVEKDELMRQLQALEESATVDYGSSSERSFPNDDHAELSSQLDRMEVPEYSFETDEDLYPKLYGYSDERAKTGIESVETDELMRRLNELDRESGTLSDPKGAKATYPDLREASTEALDTVKKAPAYSYKYSAEARERNPYMTAPGQQYGVMAQDLEQTPGGRKIVSTQPDGMKAVDTRQASMTSLAATGEIAREQDELKERLDALEKLKLAEMRSM